MTRGNFFANSLHFSRSPNSPRKETAARRGWLEHTSQKRARMKEADAIIAGDGADIFAKTPSSAPRRRRRWIEEVGTGRTRHWFIKAQETFRKQKSLTSVLSWIIFTRFARAGSAVQWTGLTESRINGAFYTPRWAHTSPRPGRLWGRTTRKVIRWLSVKKENIEESKERR